MSVILDPCNSLALWTFSPDANVLREVTVNEGRTCLRIRGDGTLIDFTADLHHLLAVQDWRNVEAIELDIKLDSLSEAMIYLYAPNADNSLDFTELHTLVGEVGVIKTVRIPIADFGLNRGMPNLSIVVHSRYRFWVYGDIEGVYLYGIRLIMKPQGVVLDPCNSLDRWTFSPDLNTLREITVDEGFTCLRVRGDGTINYFTADLHHLLAVQDWRNVEALEMDIKLDSLSEAMIQLYAPNSANSWDFTNLQLLVGEVGVIKTIRIPLSDFGVAQGTPDLATVVHSRYRFWIYGDVEGAYIYGLRLVMKAAGGGTCHGVVSDPDGAVSGALCEIPELGLTGSTDINGEIYFYNVPTGGPYTLKTSHPVPYYGHREAQFYIVEGETTDVLLSFAPTLHNFMVIDYIGLKIPYRVDENMSYVTGTTYQHGDGSHTVEMPETFFDQATNKYWAWNSWVNGFTGDTLRERILTLDASSPDLTQWKVSYDEVPPEYGYLSVYPTPSTIHASVFVDFDYGNPIGTMPIENHPLPAGPHTINYGGAVGYPTPPDDPVIIVVDQTTTTTPNYGPSLKGYMQVNATLDGEPIAAHVLIVETGQEFTTPTPLIPLDPRDYTVQCTYLQHTGVQPVEVISEQTAEVTFPFVSQIIPKGFMQIDAFSDGEPVTAQGTITSVPPLPPLTVSFITPTDPIELDPGWYTVECAYMGETQSKPEEVKAEQLTLVDFQFISIPHGMLDIHVFYEEQEVIAQGVIVETGQLFTTPILGLQVTVGPRTVKITYKGIVQQEPVTVIADQTIIVNVILPTPSLRQLIAPIGSILTGIGLTMVR